MCDLIESRVQSASPPIAGTAICQHEFPRRVESSGLDRFTLTVIELAIIVPAAWWTVRWVRRASRDLRRATFYSERALRVLVPPVTRSGVPAVPQPQID